MTNNFEAFKAIDSGLSDLIKLESTISEARATLMAATRRHKMRASQVTDTQVTAYRQALTNLARLHRLAADDVSTLHTLALNLEPA